MRPALAALVAIAGVGACSAAASRSCTPSLSFAGLALAFEDRPPHRRSEASPGLCATSAQYTCCTKAHDQALMQKLAQFYVLGPPAECVKATQVALCAACHGDVGTGRFAGLADSVCDAWLRHCGPDLFVATNIGGGELRPCSSTDVVCSRLNETVSSGVEMCDAFLLPRCGGHRCYDGSAPKRTAGTVWSAPRRQESAATQDGEASSSCCDQCRSLRINGNISVCIRAGSLPRRELQP